MSTFDLQDLREEVCCMLRNGDIMTTTVRGVTTGAYTGTATAGQTSINLAQTKVRNIRSLTIATVSKTLFKDYTVAWDTGIVTMLSGLTVGQAIAVSFDYGSSDKIYPDYPRDDLSLTSFPRVAVEMTSVRTQPFGLGGSTHISDILMTVYAWVPVNKDSAIAGGFGGTTDLNDLITAIRDEIRSNAKSLYICPFITPAGTGPIIKGMNNKTMQMSTDFQIKWKVET